jgi:hypothetical protein
MKMQILFKYVPHRNFATSVFRGLLNVFAETYEYRNVLINVINRFFGIMVFSPASRRDQVCPSRNPQPSNYKYSKDEKPNSTKPYSQFFLAKGHLQSTPC